MRKLMWFSIGFTIAAILFAYIVSLSLLLYLGIFSLLCGLAFQLFKKIRIPIAAVVLLGLGIGCLYNYSYDVRVLEELRYFDGKTVTTYAEITDYSLPSDYGTCADGKIKLHGEWYTIRIFFQEERQFQPGDRLKAEISLRYTSFGGRKEATYHQGEGIFLLGYCDDILDHSAVKQVPGKYYAASLRHSILNRLEEIFPEDSACFAKALLLGYDEEIPFEQDFALQKSGIRHVVAVSGLHVAVLMSVLYILTRNRFKLTAIIGLPVLFLFAGVAGFTPSVVRACVMQALVIIALAVNKEYDLMTALAAAVTGMLLANPLTITSPSFQLSVGCMIGILLVSHPISQYLMDKKRIGRWDRKSFKGKIARWVAHSFAASCGAMVITIPLSAVYYGMISLTGILTNLLILWLVSVSFCGILLACVCSVIWLPLGSFVAGIVTFLLRIVLFVAKMMSKIPVTVAYTGSVYTIVWIVLIYVLIILFVCSQKKKPWILAAGLALTFGLSLFATWLEPRMDNVRMTVVDVGQGQCILIQSKDKAYVVDCGGDSGEYTANALTCAMGAQGISKLDGLIITHYDADHINGVPYLLNVVSVDALYLPDTEPDNEWRLMLSDEHIPIFWVRQETTISCGKGFISLYPLIQQEQSNESSMCILFQSENCDILITGDRSMTGERHFLQQCDDVHADVLVVGHHGADTSTAADFLNAVQPKIAVISVGKYNRYGHPDKMTMDKLKISGCIILRTDAMGNIVIRG